MQRTATGLIGALVLLAAARSVQGAVFLLASGGQIEGELLNPDDRPRKTYSIRLAEGGQITLEARQVKQVVTARPDMVEYEKIRPQYPDTVEGQWALAEWCRDRGLVAARKTHLMRVIELDPEHVEARRALGYGKFDGRWLTHDERMLEQGYRKYKGQWKLPQEIQLLEDNRTRGQAEREWFDKLSRWRSWLGTNRASAAQKNIAAIDDPMAVKAVAMSLRREESDAVRLLYLEALSNIGTPEAVAILAWAAIEDQVEEVRLTSLDLLEKMKDARHAASYFVTRLKDKDNRIVNRAAVGLGRMKDPTSVLPLIDALITTHKEKITARNPGQTSASFPTGGGGGGGGFSFGSPPPKIITHHVQNPPVLDALVKITAQNYAYDQRAWRTWYAAQQRPEKVDARRD